jgi:hypothetical protein
MPSSFALPPVEYWRGTTPSHAAKSRPLTERSSVANGGDDGRGDDRSDAWDLTDTSATRICSRNAFQLRSEFFDLLFYGLPLAPQYVDEVPHLRC